MPKEKKWKFLLVSMQQKEEINYSFFWMNQKNIIKKRKSLPPKALRNTIWQRRTRLDTTPTESTPAKPKNQANTELATSPGLQYIKPWKPEETQQEQTPIYPNSGKPEIKVFISE